MKIWFDTEFIEDGKTIELLSIGMVREDGEALYRESDWADHTRASSWVAKNVLPKLRGGKIVVDKKQMVSDIVQFVGEKPEFWAYYADYDWVALCQLFGTMMDLPKDWPMYCRDVKQLCDSLGNPKLPDTGTREHDAMFDAMWTREAWEFLQEVHR